MPVFSLFSQIRPLLLMKSKAPLLQERKLKHTVRKSTHELGKSIQKKIGMEAHFYMQMKFRTSSEPKQSPILLFYMEPYLSIYDYYYNITFPTLLIKIKDQDYLCKFSK